MAEESATYHQDLQEVHGRINSLVKDVGLISVAIGRIETRMDCAAPYPVVPPRPCSDFVAHVAEHKNGEAEAKKTWKDIAWAFVGPIIASVGASFALYLGLNHK